MTRAELAVLLLSLRRKDEETRASLARSGALFEGYHPDMEVVHVANAHALGTLLDELGRWPGSDIAGNDGAEAAWIIAQHAISLPDFQRRALTLLKQAAAEGRAPAWQAAHLEDRILCFEGKKQIYGTQCDWDERGILNPKPIEDPENVDLRRARAGLPPLAQRVAELRAAAAAENDGPPRDAAKRREDAENWMKKVGWRKP